MFCKSRAIILLYLFFPSFIYSQTKSDTLEITIKQSDSLFINQNLYLLAEKCNIDAARAQIIQVKMWDNPNISIEQNAFNFQTKRAFDFTNTGETSVEFQQLFLMAGKRNKRIAMEEINTKKAEYTFYELLRTLKYELHTTFFETYYLNKSLAVYEKEIASVSKIIEIYNQQLVVGNVSLKETTRLKAFLFSLESEKNDILNKLAENQADLSMLLHSGIAVVKPMVEEPDLQKLTIDKYALQSLIDTASNNRFDLKTQEANVDFALKNLSYQKALAIPDLSFGGTIWDRDGGYTPNYNSVTIQIDIPIFNRNQGNIQTAKALAEGSKYQFDGFKEKVRSEVIQSYTKLLESEHLFKKSSNEKFYLDYEKLTAEMVKNFEARNVSMLEFLDFYDSYKDFVLQYNMLENNRLNAIEELNYSVGKNIINY